MKMHEANNFDELCRIISRIIGADNEETTTDKLNKIAPKGSVMSLVEMLLHRAKSESQFEQWSLAMETLPMTANLVGIKWEKYLELRALGEPAIEDMSQAAFERFVSPFVEEKIVARFGWWLDKYKFNEAMCQEARDQGIIPHGVGLQAHHMDGGVLCFHPVENNTVQPRHICIIRQKLADILTTQSLVEAHKIVGEDPSATEAVLALIRERDNARAQRSAQAQSDNPSVKH